MADTKHTPGPWRVMPQLRGDYFIGYNAEGNWLAEVFGPEDAPNQAKADAHLIAAAPDLLEALRSTRAIAALHMKARGFSNDQTAEAFPEADAAIAKAEGR